MGFSDYLDQPDVPRETSPTPDELATMNRPGTVIPNQRHEELSGPNPEHVAGAEVVHPWETVEGRRVIPDIVDKAAVEAAILKLTPADIRNEMLLTQRDAAQFLAITESTLRAWRERQINLPYYAAPAAGKFNQRRIFYRLSDLVRYREFVLTHVSPTDVRMPTPGMMGTPSAPGAFAPPTPPEV